MKNTIIGSLNGYGAKSVSSNDEGGIRIGLALDIGNRRVFMEFNKAVAWLSMEADEAEVLGKALLEKALLLRTVKKPKFP